MKVHTFVSLLNVPNAIWCCIIRNNRKIEAPASFHISSSLLDMFSTRVLLDMNWFYSNMKKKISITSRRMFIHVIRTRMNNNHNSSSVIDWTFPLANPVKCNCLANFTFARFSNDLNERFHAKKKEGRLWRHKDGMGVDGETWRKFNHWFALVELIRHILNHKYQHTKILIHKLGPDNLELWHRLKATCNQ